MGVNVLIASGRRHLCGDPSVGFTGPVTQIDVSPEGIHLCAAKVDEAGNEFSRAADTLRGQVDDSVLYGSDELGSALLRMDRAACPEALDYYQATGEATVETARGIDLMAGAYTRVEQDNTDQVDDIVDELGVF